MWNPHLTMKVGGARPRCSNEHISGHTHTRTHTYTHTHTHQECYESFVCVENAQTNKPVTVKPGDSWRATTNYQVVDL